MKVKKIVENCIILFFFIAVIAYPITAYFLGTKNNLSGADEKVELRFDTLDDFILQNFPGRELLIRTKNQFLYKFFDVSPNNIIVKVGDTLLSSETINYYYHGLYHIGDREVKEIVSKFVRLNEILKKKGKKMLVITTPTKVRYYNGKRPFIDDVVLAYQKQYEKLPIDVFRDEIKNNDIKLFDCIELIDSNKEKYLGGEVPLFYKEGHHWSNVKANLIGLELIEYMKKELKLKLPKIHIESKEVEEPLHPDADLFSVLNLFDKPNEQFYSPEIVYDKYISDENNYIIQGGSFLGGLLFPNLTVGWGNRVIHIENKHCLYNHYSDYVEFENYDELDEKINLLEHLKENDVFVFEVHEVNVYNASFGFIDYLLEHEDML